MLQPSAPLRLLHEDAYCTVYLDPHRHLVRYVRNSVRFPDVEAARCTFRALASIDFEGADYLLTDVRNAQGNNSPEFERLLDQVARDFFLRFRRRAALVRSVVGKMQIERLARARHDEQDFRVFQDEEQAIEWMLGSREIRHAGHAG